MGMRTTNRSKQLLRHRFQTFEAVLPELTRVELRHLLEILQRDSSPASRRRQDLVRKEIDGRRFVYLQPFGVMP